MTNKLKIGAVSAAAMTMIAVPPTTADADMAIFKRTGDDGHVERISVEWQSGQKIEIEPTRKGKSIKKITLELVDGQEPSQTALMVLAGQFGIQVTPDSKGRTVVSTQKTTFEHLALTNAMFAQIVDELMNPQLVGDSATDHASAPKVKRLIDKARQPLKYTSTGAATSKKQKDLVGA